MRGRRRPAIGGNNAVVDDWGEGKCPDMPDVIEPRDVKVLDEGLFVRVIAVRSRKRSVIDVVSPCRRNTARNGIPRPLGAYVRASHGPGTRTGKKRVSGSIGRLVVGTCESSDNVGLD